MDDELLVRAYNVGLGDCIYVRVPDNADHRHILIDCGTISGDAEPLQKALDDLHDNWLPSDASGRRQLDLLVVTHPHQDHMAGCRLEWFESIDIKDIWLTAAMDLDHPQAEGAHALYSLADTTLEEFQKVSLSPALDALLADLLMLSNEGALTALRETLPQKNDLPDGKPLYVHDGTESDRLRVFSEDTTQLHVLNPACNIDGEYLGKTDDVVPSLAGFEGATPDDALHSFAQNWHDESNHPTNISRGDFRQLRTRLLNNPLAFVLKRGELVNNTSVVLLLEWRGRRLLFAGDTQCRTSRNGRYEEGKPNGGWNVMWHHHKEELDQRVNFLLMAHHGSHNATPWKEQHPVCEILDALVPPGDQEAQVVVSTERMAYPTIPERSLMQTLGERVAHPRTYDEYEHYQGRMTGGQWNKYRDKLDQLLVPVDVKQPRRTDLEHQTTGTSREPWIDVKIPPAPGWPGGSP
jgi:hypothetical protein